MVTGLRALICAVVLGLAGTCTAAATPWYVGSFKIVRAETAPWVEAGYVPDAKEIARYNNHTVTIGKKAIKGPGLLACAKPTYELKSVEAAYLFEGGLAVGPHPEAAADAAAAKLGFKKGHIEALETGCESEITYQFRDHDNAAFALDNVIYWIARKK